jgi:lactate permease
MWTQPYQPVAGSVAASAVVAALPLIVIGVALAVWRMASWKASLLATGTAFAVAVVAYGMPLSLALWAAVYGAAFGLFQLGLIVYAAILLFDIVVESGRFGAIRESLAQVSADERVQVLVIAFAFGAFLEGATGAGTPVAVCASLLVGIGFSPLRAGALSLLANTAPVAFGALGLPIVTLAAVTALPLHELSAAVGRICPIIGLLIPSYLIAVHAGSRAVLDVWPAVVVCGVMFAVTQFAVSNTIGPYLADILSALATMAVLVGLLRFWRPAATARRASPPAAATSGVADGGHRGAPDTTMTGERNQHRMLRAWSPYLLLVVIVILWGAGPSQRLLNRASVTLPVPRLHLAVVRSPPVVPSRSAYPAVFVFNWLSTAGSACLVTALAAAVMTGIGGRRFLAVARRTAGRLALPELTIALVVAIAFIMNYAGATGTLGIATAATGRLFPFFGAYLGWLGVFLTGSDTSSNALFGPLQVVSAQNLHLNPILMAAVNTCGGVMGKMVSIQSIAVAAAATGMSEADEGELFRLTLKHSVLLTSVVGAIASVYAYVVPHWIPGP